MTLAIVFKYRIAGHVIAHEHVCIPVIVVVRTDHPHTGARVCRNTGRLADIGEGPVTVVAKQGVLRPIVVHGPHIGRITVEAAGLMVAIGKVHIIGHKEIEVSVQINVQKRSAGPHLIAIGHTRSQGHVCKRTIPVVSVQDIGAKIVDIDVAIPVIVIIANGHTQPIARVPDPCRVCHFRELPRAIIAVEGVARDTRGLRALQGGTVEKIDVHIPVIVIVKQTHTCSDCLHNVAFS